MSNRPRSISYLSAMLHLAFAVVVCAQTGAPVLDQQQASYEGGLSARTLPGYTVWQSFTAGISGTMSSIHAGFFNNMSGDGQLTVFAGAGVGGTLLQSVNVAVVGITQPGVTWNIWAVSVPIVAGSQYTFQLTPNAATLADPYGVAIGSGYAGGNLGLVSGVAGSSVTQFDWVFQTYVLPSGSPIVPPPPTISGLSPSSATAGGSAFTLTVSGTGFAPGAVVQWGGTGLATSFVGATQLTATVGASLLAYAGAVSISVTSGGLASPSATFTINAPNNGPLNISGIWNITTESDVFTVDGIEPLSTSLSGYVVQSGDQLSGNFGVSGI